MPWIPEQLAEFIHGLDCDALPAEVQAKVKTHMQDTLGVMLGGSTWPASV